MRNATRILLSYRLFFVMLALTASWPVCLAQIPSVQTIDYQNGALSIRSSAEMEAPQVEAWPGTIGEQATELVILSFPHATADLAALQQIGDQLILKNPELKRYLVSPLSSDKKGNNGFQLVVEVAISPNSEVRTPTASLIQPNQWLIALKQNAQFSIATTASNVPDAPTSAKTDKPSSIPTPPASVPATNGTDPQLLHTIQDLQAQITHLSNALQTSTGKQQALQEQLAQYTDFIRPYQPEFNGAKEDLATIQNLRLALVKVAEKLKATETALAKQTDKTRDLARQLAELKNDPSVATDPSLFIQIADDVSSPPKPVPPRSLADESLKPQPASPTKLSVKSERPSPAVTESPKTTAPLASTKTVASSDDNRKTVANQEKTLQAVLHANPKQWQAYLDLSALYATNGNSSAAESLLIRLLKANPGYAPGYYHLAQLYVQQKRMLEAQAALDTYQRLQPGDIQGIRTLQSRLQGTAKPPQINRPSS